MLPVCNAEWHSSRLIEKRRFITGLHVSPRHCMPCTSFVSLSLPLSLSLWLTWLSSEGEGWCRKCRATQTFL